MLGFQASALVRIFRSRLLPQACPRSQSKVQKRFTSCGESTGGGASSEQLIAVAISYECDLMNVDLDYFPPFFRGFVASENPNVRVTEIEDALPPDVATFPKAVFVIENCPLETVQRFCKEYETRTNCAPDTENELIVLQITLESGPPPTHQGLQIFQ